MGGGMGGRGRGGGETQRRIFIGGVPPGANDEEVRSFLENALRQHGLVDASAPRAVDHVVLKPERRFGFATLPTPELATAAQALSGIPYDDSTYFIVSRPKGYVPPPGAPPDPQPLFDAASRHGGGPSSSSGGVMGATLLPTPNILSAPGEITPTPVLQLFNMVVRDELLDPEEVEDIKLDVREECETFGVVKDVAIPVPAASVAQDPPGVGNIYVLFATADEALRASQEISGRTFGDRTVITSFYDQDRFLAGDLV